MPLVKCPDGHVDTAAGVGDTYHCLTCGKAFNSEGEFVSGPDQNTKDIIMARLADKQPHVVGNLADLNRLGAEKAPDPSEPEFVLPPGAEDAAPPSEATADTKASKASASKK